MRLPLSDIEKNSLSDELNRVDWRGFSDPENPHNGLINIAQWFVAINYLKSKNIFLDCDARGHLYYRGAGRKFVQSLADLHQDIISNYSEDVDAPGYDEPEKGGDIHYGDIDPVYLSLDIHTKLYDSIMDRLTGNGRLFYRVSLSTKNKEDPVTRAMLYLVHFLLHCNNDLFSCDKPQLISNLKDHYSVEIYDGRISSVHEICPTIVEKKIAINPNAFKKKSFINEVFVLRQLAGLLRGCGEDKTELASCFLFSIYSNVSPDAGDYMLYFPRLDFDLVALARLHDDRYKRSRYVITEHLHSDLCCLMSALVGGVYNAIEFIHLHGFFHRDLKPENILVTQSHGGKLILKITDFASTYVDFPEGSPSSSGYECKDCMDEDYVTPDINIDLLTLAGTTPEFMSPMMLLFLTLRYGPVRKPSYPGNSDFMKDSIWESLDMRSVLERNDWWAFIAVISESLRLLFHQHVEGGYVDIVNKPGDFLIINEASTAHVPISLYDAVFYNRLNRFLALVPNADVLRQNESGQKIIRFRELCERINEEERADIIGTPYFH